MKIVIVIIVILLLIYIWENKVKQGHLNTKYTPGDIYLHNLHQEDSQQARDLVIEIKKRISVLLLHLGKKYSVSVLKNGADPDRKNRIDQIGTSSMYSEYDVAAKELEKHHINREELLERIRQLFDNYDGNIYEISPTNKENLTSYTENKVKLILCLRHKKPDANGIYKLHDINTMMFVVVHELTHILNDEYDHGKKFWVLFEFMLHNAVEAGIYKPEDYHKNNIKYCGLDITYNPLYDPIFE